MSNEEEDYYDDSYDDDIKGKYFRSKEDLYIYLLLFAMLYFQ